MFDESVIPSLENPEDPTPTSNNAIPSELFTAGDAARIIMVSVTTVKRHAAELRLDPIMTAGGLKLYTAGQVEEIKNRIRTAPCARR